MRYLTYNKFTGEITAIGSCQLMDLEKQVTNQNEQVLGLDESHIDIRDNTHYIDISVNQIVEKMKLDVSISKLQMNSDSIDSCTISNIPNGVDVVWENKTKEPIIDGSLEISCNQPGIYKIALSGIKYLKEEITLEAIN